MHWMTKVQGFEQSKNDVCAFRHPITRLKVGLHVDDNMHAFLYIVKILQV